MNKDFYNDLPGMVCIMLDELIEKYSKEEWFEKAWEEYRQHILSISMDDMKVEIGEYLRLDNGYIYKWKNNDYEYIKWDEEDKTYVYGNGANEYEWESDIVNHSFNIIDLIEVGDYVNRKLVGKIEDIYTTDNIYIGKFLYEKNCSLIGGEEDIKSIVTNEQFSQMEYKVGE